MDTESCYRAVKSRDRRFDGVFYTAVRTTGIYCRPSCPARTPAYGNVTFHPSAAAAQAAGFRACKRCLPDATPGSPDWDVAADAAGRAMRLIGDGVVDREGVEGLAHRVGYTSRHLHPAAHRRARRRAARAGPRQARADRPHPGRDHRPAARRRRLRGGLREHPAVQRDGARGLRDVARASSAAGAAGRAASGARAAAGRADAVRRRGAARLPRLPPGGGRRDRRTRVVRPHARPSPRSGTVRLALPQVDRAWARPRSSPRRSPSPTCATPPPRSSGPAGSSTPTATPWPSTTSFAGDPVSGRSCGTAGAPRPRPGRRRRGRRPHRDRPAGQRGRRLDGHRPARRGARATGRDRRSPG